MNRSSQTSHPGHFFQPLLAALLALATTGNALAANVTDIASAFDEDNPWDLNFSVTYGRTLRRGLVQRQLTGRSVTQGRVELVKELRYTQITQTLALRAEIGIWRDLQIHVEFPITVSDSRSLGFAQNGGDPCGAVREDNCVTPRNSTVVRDGFLDGSKMSPTQIDVAGAGGAPGGLTLPGRSGLDQVYLGLSWAPVNQTRDYTKPTWVIGFEARIGTGTPMTYDPTNPQANTSVSRGLHELHWFTEISRRFRYIDTWMGIHYLRPLAKSSSLFSKTTFNGSGQERADPRQRGWVDFGLEVTPWEIKKEHHRFSVELSGRIGGVFEGRGYSPIWELLAGQRLLQGRCLAEAGNKGPLTWDNGTYCSAANQLFPYPGITHIENYLVLQGTLAFHLALSKFFFGKLSLGLGHETEHAITFADAGRALCSAQNPKGCTGEITPTDPKQVNPLYRPSIDAPGRRFYVSEATIFDLMVQLKVLF